LLFLSWTPLHYACAFGSKDIIRLYINYGADIRLLTKDGITPRDMVLQRINSMLIVY